MSSYIKATDFAAKDALPTGDPLKTVSGTEIDDEFDAIQTAVNSKANSASPSLTGTPLTPTATPGTNTTQIASTEFVKQAIDTAVASTKQALYPVGSIYTNATDSTNPATLLGFGTWAAFGAGRVMVGFNSGNALFNASEKTGGVADSVLPSHTHTASVSTASLTGSFTTLNRDGGLSSNRMVKAISGIFNSIVAGGDFGEGWQGGAGSGSSVTSIDASHNHTVTNSTEGVSATNANYQPFITVYMWKRTA